MKKIFFLSIAFIGLSFCLTFNVNGQGLGVNSSGNAPDASAILDASATNKGLLIPRMTTAQRNAIVSPAEGLQLFNTTTKCLEIYANGVWQSTFCSCYTPSAAGSISGTATVCPGQSGVSYSVPSISNASSYGWSYSGTGATIIGSSNSITIDFSSTATSGNLTVMGISACGSGTVSAAYPITVNIGPPGSQTFSFTGALQTWVVPSWPSCVNSVTIEAWGGQGGNCQGCTMQGANGGYAKGDLTVTPGQTLYIYVGGSGNAGGFNGGGSGYGNGGGASDVRTSVALGARVIVAGGGGGMAEKSSSNSGAGGGTIGTDASDSQSYPCNGCGSCSGTWYATGGGGGTQSAGGAGGFSNGGTDGVAGSLGFGASPIGNGSGGGGGYYGGGSGCGAYCSNWPSSGGGGSGYVGGVTNSSMTTGVRAGNGEVKITW